MIWSNNSIFSCFCTGYLPIFLRSNSKLNIMNMSFPKIILSYPITEEVKIEPRRIIRISCRMLTLNRALQQSLFSFSPLYYSECIWIKNSQRVQKGRLISLGFLQPQIERSNCEKIRDLLQPWWSKSTKKLFISFFPINAQHYKNTKVTYSLVLSKWFLRAFNVYASYSWAKLVLDASIPIFGSVFRRSFLSQKDFSLPLVFLSDR